jgi:hypothetical protein
MAHAGDLALSTWVSVPGGINPMATALAIMSKMLAAVRARLSPCESAPYAAETTLSMIALTLSDAPLVTAFA